MGSPSYTPSPSFICLVVLLLCTDHCLCRSLSVDSDCALSSLVLLTLTSKEDRPQAGLIVTVVRCGATAFVLSSSRLLLRRKTQRVRLTTERRLHILVSHYRKVFRAWAKGLSSVHVHCMFVLSRTVHSQLKVLGCVIKWLFVPRSSLKICFCFSCFCVLLPLGSDISFVILLQFIVIVTIQFTPLFKNSTKYTHVINKHKPYKWQLLPFNKTVHNTLLFYGILDYVNLYIPITTPIPNTKHPLAAYRTPIQSVSLQGQHSESFLY